MDKKIIKLIQKEYKKRFASKRFIPGQTLIPASGKAFDWQEMAAITEAALDGWWTEGRFADVFEKQFAAWVGTKHCIMTTSGSSANLLAIAALTSYHLGSRRLKPGDEVITIAAGFPTTINPLIIYGLIPVFVDIDLKTYNIKIDNLLDAITKKTKAIFIPHNLGSPFHVDVIKKICKRRNIWLIEDCCDALGSLYKKKKVGSFGDLATFSFYAGHHMTTGEGGAVVTRDPRLAAITRSFRDWGREYWFKTGEDKKLDVGLGSFGRGALPKHYDIKFIFSEIGYNLKITDMQAALGLVQLKKIAKFTKIRKANFNYFIKKLAVYKKYFLFPEARAGSDPSWFGFLLTIRPDAPFTREELINYLHKNKIATRMFLAGNVTKQPYFRNYNIRYRISGSLPNTDFILNQSFWVGLYQAIDGARRKYIINTIKNFLVKYE